MTRSEVFEQERLKLAEIFQDVDPPKAQLVQGLIDDAAFLFAENQEMRSTMTQTGMVRVHPNHPELQKTSEVAKQYLKNVNAYSVVIKALNGILQKNVIEGDDAFDAFVDEMRRNE